MNDDDKNYWLSRGAWTGFEAACLLHGYAVGRRSADNFEKMSGYRKLPPGPGGYQFVDRHLGAPSDSYYAIVSDEISTLAGDVVGGILKAERIGDTPRWFYTPKDVIAWATKKGSFPEFPFLDSDMNVDTVEAPAVRIPATQAQDARLKALLKQQGYDSENLPDGRGGKPGVKAEIRELALREKNIFSSVNVFNKAWERLRSDNANI